MKTVVILFSVIVALSTTLSSCKKGGCTDKNAINYNSGARKSDGSCSFEGRVILWYGQNASTELQNNGATALTFYVDGQPVGSTQASVYWNHTPVCGENGSITIKKSLGKAKNKSYIYSVKDQDNVEYWSGDISIMANTCEGYELVW